MIKIASASPSQTAKLGQVMGTQFKGGEILALRGDLGSGKTTFVKGLARGLGIRQNITSPTFAIYNRYPAHGGRKTFYHFDLYRLHTPADLEELGFEEIISDPKNIIAIEWPKKAEKILSARAIYFQFDHSSKLNQRIIKTWQKKS